MLYALTLFLDYYKCIYIELNIKYTLISRSALYISFPKFHLFVKLPSILINEEKPSQANKALKSIGIIFNSSLMS